MLKTSDINKKYRFVCAGTAIADCIVREFDPEPVSKTGFTAESTSLVPGGEAVNQSIILSRLGKNSDIVCCMGDDPVSGILKNALIENGVGTGCIRYDNPFGTPLTVMFVDADGNRKSITNRAHKYNFHPEKDLSFLEGTKGILLGSLFRAPFDDPEIIQKIFAAAAEKDVQIFADTKLPNFRKLTIDDIAPALPYLDYIFPNEDEAEYCSGKTDPDDMAKVLLDYGIRNVIIKLGDKGCLFRNAKERIRLPALHVKAVDATGAGDNFIAGFVTALDEGKDHYEALRFANACGAVCTTEVGAVKALKNRAQAEEMLSSMNIQDITDPGEKLR